MNQTFYRLFLSLILFIILNNKALAVNVSVGSLSDLKKPLEEIKIAYEKDHTNDYVSYTYLPEDEIFKTLKQHPEVLDIIIIDNIKSIDKGVNEGYLKKESVNKLFKDKLCVIVKKSIVMRPFMLYPKTLVTNAVAVGNVDTTSLGKYTKEALTNLSLWKKLNYKLVFFNNNDLLTKAIGRGFYDGGVSYYSFAKNAFVEITDILNPKIYSPIIYASAISTHAKEDEAIEEFNKFLISPPAKKIFKKYHFTL